MPRTINLDVIAATRPVLCSGEPSSSEKRARSKLSRVRGTARGCSGGKQALSSKPDIRPAKLKSSTVDERGNNGITLVSSRPSRKSQKAIASAQLSEMLRAMG